MPRYAMIDIHTGYVWGVQDADDPIHAASLLDTRMGEPDRIYEQHGPRSAAARDGRSGYLVHGVPPGFDVDDGQDQDEIDRVEEHPCVAIVTVLQDTTDPDPS